jgi:hypothetical protein
MRKSGAIQRASGPRRFPLPSSRTFRQIVRYPAMPLHRFRRALLAILLPAVLGAQTPTNSSDRKVKPPTSSGQWSLSLLPKSMDKNARVDMTVFGEVTSAGAAKPLPTAQSPQYYVAQSGGYRPDRIAPLGEKTPSDATVTTHIDKSLRAAGYLPAEEGKTPDLLVVFHWGSQYGRDEDSTIMTRALLIGGDAFAKELDDVLRRQREERQLQRDLTGRQTVTHFSASGRTTFTRQNVNTMAAFASFSPIEQFKRRDDNNALLLEQATGDLYYVLISAYDFPALQKGQRVLLWRTRLTVDASGVSLVDTLPALLFNAGPYLGKETGRAGTFTKKMLRSGSVEIGPSEVIDDNVAEPRPAAPTPKPGKP